MALWMLMLEEVQDAKKIKIIKYKTMKTFFVILHIVCLNNENWTYFSAQEPNKKKIT